MAELSLSVSELNEYVRDKLQTDPVLKLISVRGEISDFKLQSGSGHAYFTLKDEKAVLSCTMWRSNVSLLRFVPKPGKKVLVKGQVTIYTAGGKYQLIADSIKEEGTGDLFARFEALKNKLMLEGLFDQAIKKPIPLLSSTIGVATSPSGAAIRDIIKVARARNPKINIVIAPCSVQGKGAELEIARAVNLLDKDGRAEVILVGRGGGSMEDLWAFNEEAVARAIYHCSKPVISCVGHETDFSIADFAADMRASTPSNAAEIAVADISVLKRQAEQFMLRLNTSMLNAHRQRATRLENAFNSKAFADPMAVIIEAKKAEAEALYKRMDDAHKGNLKSMEQKTDNLIRLLESMNPENIIKRGYAVVRQSSNIISRVEKIKTNENVTVELSDGGFKAGVKQVWRNENE